MAKSSVFCSQCSKYFLKDNRYINQNKKLRHQFYCSIECQSSYKNKQIKLSCENPHCSREYYKKVSRVSKYNYCSRSCAITINNAKFPKKIAAARKCRYCGKRFYRYNTYCSVECKFNATAMQNEEIINQIKKFYNEHGRIPLKMEFCHYNAARKRFGNWNNAVEAAGFKPNPVKFAEKCVAKDGHKCDSIAEMIIDNYLFRRGIIHERNTSYPEGTYTADFKVEDKLIEYFGLAGEHKRYDEVKRIKQRIAKKYNLNVIEIYPEDLYSKNRLGKLLEF